jgi:hypothetical protein
VQGINGPEYFDAPHSWRSRIHTNRRLEKAAARHAAAEDAPPPAFSELQLEDRRLVSRAAFEVVTQPWAGKFCMKQGYARFREVLGDACFWPSAENQEGIAAVGAHKQSTLFSMN